MTFTHLPTAWRCKDGRIIKLVAMEDSHLTNVIGRVYRAAEKVALHIYNRELMYLCSALSSVGGEGAEDAVHSELAQLQPHTAAEVLATWPIWHALRLEADRRAALVGCVPLPEAIVLCPPDVQDVPRWASDEPQPPPAVRTYTQVRRVPIRAIAPGEGEETNWGDD